MLADFARDKTCKLRWSRTNGGLVKNQCRVYDSQIFVVGDYEKHECAIQVRAESILIPGNRKSILFHLFWQKNRENNRFTN